MVPTLDDVVRAADVLSGHAVRTPFIDSKALNERVGRNVFLKLETLQHTGSFKFRGAYNRLSNLSEGEKKRGVVAYSSGNHAQAVAFAAKQLGLSAVIVMPSDAPRVKIDKTRGHGAEVVFYDRLTESRETIAADIANKSGRVLVPPYEDGLVIAGQGTAALEIVEDVQRLGIGLDAVLICCGGGGLTAGCALVFEGLLPGAKVFTVEPDDFDDTARSLAQKKRVSNPSQAHSICDALLAPSPGELTFSINESRVTGGVRVSDTEVMRAISYASRELKVVLEPGGAVALAAALAGKLPPGSGAVALMCSGGNIDTAILERCIKEFPAP